MLVTADLTQREEELLRWLLNPEFSGKRMPGLNSEDADEIARVIGRLQNVERKLDREITERAPEMKGVYQPEKWISSAIDVLQSGLAQLRLDLAEKRTVHISKIQYRSHDGIKNDDEARRFFFASLMARKRGVKPYEFISDFLEKSFSKHVEATAIAVRVSRFEKRLTGVMSCEDIIGDMYCEFLSHRGQENLISLQARLRRREIFLGQYVAEFNRIVSPNPEERQWLNSLCAFANYPKEPQSGRKRKR